MKKILVVLLILAVAGGVFAQQGTFSFSSAGGVGAHINLDPDPLNDGDVPLVRGANYQRPYRQYTQIWGELGIKYNRGNLGTGLTFTTEGQIVGNANITGENYKFQVSSNVNEFFTPGGSGLNGGGESADTNKFVDRLWGSYTMLNDLVLLEVAYRSRDAHFWFSDVTAAIDGDNFRYGSDSKGDGPGPNTYSFDTSVTDSYKLQVKPNFRRYSVTPENLHDFTANNPSQAVFMDGATFTKVDRGNYLLGQVETGGLQMGLMIPNFFPTTYTTGNANAWQGKTPAFTTFSGAGGSKWGSGVQFVNDVLAQSIFGAKFTMQPVEVAAQIKVQDFGVYFGGKFFAGPVTVGLSFMGVMGKVPLDMTGTGGPQYAADQSELQTQRAFGTVVDGSVSKIGGRVDYNGGSFGAGIKGFWGKQGGKAGSLLANGDKAPTSSTISGSNSNDGLDRYYTVIGIEPVFYINAIPSYFRFTLSGGFYFETYTAPEVNSNTIADVKATYWALQPEISWNFRGTGAVDNYHGMNTGMFARYRIVSKTVNALDLVFLFGL